MSNQVTIVCPYCGHVGDSTLIRYHRFPKVGAAYSEIMPDGQKTRDLESGGELDCEKCEETFLYKFDIKVISESAKLPTYREIKL